MPEHRRSHLALGINPRLGQRLDPSPDGLMRLVVRLDRRSLQPAWGHCATRSTLPRDFDATLVPVLAWMPPGGDLADRRTPCDELRRIWAQDAWQQLQDALNMAWGKQPADLLIRPLVRRGYHDLVLVNAACRPGDLLVVGPAARAPWPALWAAGRAVTAWRTLGAPS